MCTKPASGQRGFTLIELIIFIVVVSVGLVGILSVLNVTVMRSADPVYPKQSLAIAETLLEEIQAKDFSPPGTDNFTPSSDPPPVGERQNFDDVFDFNNYGSSASGIFDITGAAITALANYRALVTICHPGTGCPAATGPGALPATDVWVITIQVTDPAGTVHTFTGYRLNYG